MGRSLKRIPSSFVEGGVAPVNSSRVSSSEGLEEVWENEAPRRPVPCLRGISGKIQMTILSASLGETFRLLTDNHALQKQVPRFDQSTNQGERWSRIAAALLSSLSALNLG